MIHETDIDPLGSGMAGANDPGRRIGSESPQPCWIALDAAREQAFTGEIVFHATPEVRVYLDNGVAYYAERSDDTTLGRRLLDSGLIDPVQLERGMVRVGGVEHLGRLFDRDPSVDRDAVMVTVEDATQALLADLANNVIATSRATAYRHHESGVHRWFVAPSSAGAVTRPVSDVALVDNSIVEDLPGLPSAEHGSLGDELRIEWDLPLADVAPSTGRDESDADFGQDLLVADAGGEIAESPFVARPDAGGEAAPHLAPPPTDAPTAAPGLTNPDAAEPTAPAEPAEAAVEPPEIGFESLVIDLDALIAPIESGPLVDRRRDPVEYDAVAVEPDAEIALHDAVAPAEVIVPMDDEFRIVWPDGTEEAPTPPVERAIAGEVLLPHRPVETAEPTDEPTGADAPEPIAEPTGAELGEPAVEPVSEPIGAELVEPAVEPVSEPTGAELVEPAVEPVTGPTGAELVEPVSEPTGAELVEPAVEPVTGPAGAELGERAVEPVSEPAGAELGKRAVEPVSEPIGAELGERAVKPVTEPTGAEPTGAEPTGAEQLEPTGAEQLEPIVEPAVELHWASDELAPWQESDVNVVDEQAATSSPTAAGAVDAIDAPAPVVDTETDLASADAAAPAVDATPEASTIPGSASETAQAADQDEADRPAEPDAAPSSIDFEVPALVLSDLPSADGVVPDEVSNAVLRAIRAIENASTAPPAVAPIVGVEATPDAPPAEPPPAPMGFAPPTLDTSAEAIYAARAKAAVAEQEAVEPTVSAAVDTEVPESRVASVVFVDDDEAEPEPEDRAGALRRLISSLRRR